MRRGSRGGVGGEPPQGNALSYSGSMLLEGFSMRICSGITHRITYKTYF